MRELKEKYPGVNGETFLIRIVDTGMSIVSEIYLVYEDGPEEKLSNLRFDRYEHGVDFNIVMEETKSKISLITIIKREANIDLFKKE